MTNHTPEPQLDHLAEPIQYGVEEISESLNYFDEIAITKHFGQEWTDLSSTITLRALAFILERRNGLTDKDAFHKVTHMRLADVNDYFTFDHADAQPPEAELEDDLDDEPVLDVDQRILDDGPVGNGDALPGPPPTTSQPSAS